MPNDAIFLFFAGIAILCILSYHLIHKLKYGKYLSKQALRVMRCAMLISVVFVAILETVVSVLHARYGVERTLTPLENIMCGVGVFYIVYGLYELIPGMLLIAGANKNEHR